MLIRTEKQINLKNIDLNFIRLALRLGSNDSYPLKAPEVDFTMEEKFIGKFGCGYTGHWDDSLLERGYVKHLSNIELTIEGFDSTVLVWQDGHLTGFYTESYRTHFAKHNIEWVNLMIEYGFMAYDQHKTKILIATPYADKLCRSLSTQK